MPKTLSLSNIRGTLQSNILSPPHKLPAIPSTQNISVSLLKVTLEGTTIEVEKSITVAELYDQLSDITSFDYCVTTNKNYVIDHLLSNPTNTLRNLKQELQLSKMMFHRDKHYELLYLLG